MERFQNADAIFQGACNPSGISHSILEAIAECRSENANPCKDPAVRIMVYQLAAICGFEPLEHNSLISEAWKEVLARKA